MTVAAIVQARMGSTRLPGKVMYELNGQPVLHHVLARCSQIAGVDVVMCAVPDADESRPLETVAKACGAQVFRGSEQDVLARYLGAARSVRADVILRVTSDCPLIDPDICATLLALLSKESADYAANNMPPSYPHGLDCEAFTFAALEEAAGKASAREDREHVTPWIRRALHLRRANLHSGNPELARHRWTLDFREDFSFLQAVCAHLSSLQSARMTDVLTVLERHPDIQQLNESRMQR